MKVWEEYALIDDGIIKQIGCFHTGGYSLANQLARARFGSDAIAIEVSQYNVEEGYEYKADAEGNYHFYHGTEVIVAHPTEEQQVATNKADIEDVNDAIDELILAITPTEG